MSDATDKIVFKDGRISFEGPGQTELEALAADYKRHRSTLLKKLNSLKEQQAAFKQELDAIEGFDAKAFKPISNQIKQGTLKAADVKEEPLRKAAEKLEALLTEHAGEEHKAIAEFQVKGGSRRIAELTEARRALIAEAQKDITKIEGHTPEAAKTITGGLKTLEKETGDIAASHVANFPKSTAKSVAMDAKKEAGNFVKRHWNKAKANLGKEARAESKLKFSGRLLGTFAGVILMGDAVFRSTTQEGDQKVERSFAGRSGEFGGGLATTLLSLLAGARGK